jgi:hypothetical protein
MTAERRWHWLLPGLAILVLAFTLRVYVVERTVIDHPVRADAADYLAYALNLQRYGVYSRDHAAADAALLAMHLLGPPAGVVVGMLCALSPHLVNMNVYLLSETLFAGLLAIALVTLCTAGAATPRRWLLAGLALGTATLTRPWPLLLAPLLAAATLVGQRGARAAWSAAALLLLGFAMVYLPWPLRNALTLGTSGDPTLVINGLQHGMYPDFMFDGRPESYGFPYRHDPATPTISQSVGHAFAAIAERFATRPGEHLAWYLWGKPLALLSWSTVHGVGGIFVYPPLASPYLEAGLVRASAALMQALHVPLMSLAVACSASTAAACAPSAFSRC